MTSADHKDTALSEAVRFIDHPDEYGCSIKCVTLTSPNELGALRMRLMRASNKPYPGQFVFHPAKGHGLVYSVEPNRITVQFLHDPLLQFTEVPILKNANITA